MKAGAGSSHLSQIGSRSDWVDDAFAELEKVGYTVASAYTAVKTNENTLCLSRQILGGGSARTGRGELRPHRRDALPNHHDFEPYVSAVNAGKLPVYRALTPTDDERLIREFVLQLKLGASAEYFAKKFGVDPRNVLRSRSSAFATGASPDRPSSDQDQPRRASAS